YAGLAKTVTVYDIAGRNASGYVPITSSSTYVNDAFGRLVSVTPPAVGASALYEYDERDHLVAAQLTDQSAPTRVQVRRFVYDSLGRLREAANPENGTVRYTKYDARGNLLSYTDALGNTFNMTYDAADRLVSKTNTGGWPLVANNYD